MARLDPNAFHSREIDHESTIADGLARNAVASASNGNQEAMLASEADTCDYVGYASTPRNDGGSAVNHCVRKSSNSVIARLAWPYDLTAMRLREVLDCRF
jgi:hypothetical protein